MANAFKEAALLYASRGWKVHPLKPNTKVPLFTGWQQKATTDPAQIEAWWDEWPDANVGLLSGSIGIIVDVDCKHGQPGLETWARLEGENGKTETACVRSPSGGNHYYYSLPPGVVVGNSPLVAGLIDIRANGGNIAAPPSVIDDKRYVWLDERDPTVAPEWLLRMLSAPKSSQPASGGANALVIAEGGRNDTLFRRACGMRQIGLAEDEIFERVWAVNLTECVPPLEEKEVRTLVKSAAGYDSDFRMTDLGNAQRLVALFGQDIRFIPQFKSWFYWNGKIWQRDENGEVERYAEHTIEFLYQRVIRMPPSASRDKLMAFALRSHMKARLTAMTDLAESQIEVAMMTPEDFNTDNLKLAVANGVLDLQSGELLPFDRRDYITQQVNITYDPEADCPVWKTALHTMTGGDAETLRYLQQLAGYCLTGETREQGFYVLWGPGANGKTTFQRVLEMLVGPYSVTVQASTFAKSKFHQIHNQLASMYGKRVVTTSEVEEGQEFSEVTLKTLTGQDIVAARDLYQKWFNYVPQYKLVIATNYRPRLSGYDEAVWRRVNLIPFSVVIPSGKRDPHLLAKLKGELSGILNWAVEGCVDWQKNGLVVPQAVLAATNAYRASMDTIEDWLNTCCRKDASAKAGITALHESYVRFCKAEGYDYPYGRRRFSEIMQGKGFIHSRGTGGYAVLLGIALNIPQEASPVGDLPFQ